MISSVDSTIQKAKELARTNDADGAMLLADQLIAEHPNEVEVWLLRGYLHERSTDHVRAERDVTHAIELNSLEPHLYLHARQMSIRNRRGRASGLGRVQTRSRSRFASFLRHGDDALQIVDGHVPAYFRNLYTVIA